MSVAVKPGDVLELSCPGTSLPQVSAGQQFPPEAKEKNYVVVSVNGGKVTVGPVRGGEYVVTIPCSDGQSVTETIQVQPTPTEALPPKQPPVMPLAIAFPLWFWIALGIAGLALGAGIYGIVRYFNGKRKPVVSRKEARVPTGEEIFEAYLTAAERGRQTEVNEPRAVVDLYAKGNDALRLFLEQRLHFKASWATTSEFLGTLKSSLLGYQGLNETAHLVETLLTQADLVRFSKDLPPPEARKAFVQNLRKVQTTVTKATREATTS